MSEPLGGMVLDDLLGLRVEIAETVDRVYRKTGLPSAQALLIGSSSKGAQVRLARVLPSVDVKFRPFLGRQVRPSPDMLADDRTPASRVLGGRSVLAIALVSSRKGPRGRFGDARGLGRRGTIWLAVGVRLSCRRCRASRAWWFDQLLFGPDSPPRLLRVG
jgi:hypothetical protein